jgi:RNA polymerase sigma factor (sigma-70 family)
VDRKNPDHPPEGGSDQVSDQIRAVVDGDPAALDWVVEWMSPLMLTWARLQLRPGGGWSLEPEDLVQDVWVRVLPELGTLRPHPEAGERLTPALVGLVKRILRNRVIDVRRQATRRQVFGLPAGSSSGPQAETPSSGPFSKALRSERRQLVQAALDRLTARERALYVKRLFEAASLDELAAEFGMSKDAVIKARQRVRQKLSALLALQILDDLESA